MWLQLSGHAVVPVTASSMILIVLLRVHFSNLLAKNVVATMTTDLHHMGGL